MADPKLFLVCRNVERESLLRKGLAEAGPVNLVGVYRVAESAGDLEALISAARPEGLYVDSSVPSGQALELAQRAKARMPRLAVILGTPEKDFDFLQAAMGAGMDGVMPEPIDLAEVRKRLGHVIRKRLEALEAMGAAGEAAGPGALTARMKAVAAAGPAEAAPVGKGVILAFVSGKDGEGKTTVALNLGLSLAKKFGKSVLYLDLTETLSETGMMLDQKPPGTLLDILAMGSAGPFSPYAIEKNAIDYFEDGSFRAIAGNPTIVPPELDRDALDLLLRFVRSQADFVLLDCPPRFGDSLKTALKLSDWHVVVVQNTLTSLRNARAFLSEIKRLEFPAHQVRLVLNRVSKTAGLAKDDIAKNLDPYPVVTAVVSNGPLAIEAITVGKPVVLHAPESDIAESIHTFSKKLLGIETSDVDEASKGFSLGSMISTFLGG